MTSEFTFETDHGPITVRRYSSHDPRAAVILAHGAGAGQFHPFMMAAATAFTAAGFETITFDFPYMEAGRRAQHSFAMFANVCSSVGAGSGARRPASM